MRSATKNAAHPSFSPCPKPCNFDTFQPLTPEQVFILIKRAPEKTSDLELVSTWLVQEFAPIFAPFFAHVFNVSLERGYLPARRKGRLFIRALRNHRLILMIYLTIVPSQTLALFLSCLSGLFMLSCSSI